MYSHSPCVELTKICYYDQKRISVIPTISRQLFNNQQNHNIKIIKRNIFGHKWVMKVNECQTEDNCKKQLQWKLIGYILVFACIGLAVGFGLFFSLETYLTKTLNPIIVPKLSAINNTIIKNVPLFCPNCDLDEVCLVITEQEVPKCWKIKDKHDPTGCGGLCKINTEFCQKLDHRVHQCRNITRGLTCPKNHFNCGNRCISASKKCDGFVDCSNYSDETNCECNLQTHFRCKNNTSCLENRKKCNGIIDCWDKSDELNCYRNCRGNLLCQQTNECISKDKFCNGKYDCKDKSDEPELCKNI